MFWECLIKVIIVFLFHFRYPMSFNAYFSAGSDPEFSVSPSTGELLPIGTNGTMIRVAFLPSVYGKIYTGKLIIQVMTFLVEEQ